MRHATRTRRRLRLVSIAASFAALAMVASSCGGDDDGNGDAGDGNGDEGDTAAEGDAADGMGVDDGSTITMWTRAATEAQSQRLVDAYNESHENQVELTVVPTDDYLPRLGTAAGAGELPDVVGLDVVFVPQFTTVGAFLDITDRIEALPFADSIAPSHVDVGTFEDRKHVVPHTMDLSVYFYNKDLYEQAGLDPEQPPATLEEFAEHARAIDDLGDDVHGTFFGGNCPGCYVFTWWPSIWADGHEVMNDDGTEAMLDSPEAQAVYDVWKGLVEDDVIAPGTQDEAGPTWTGVFPEGDIGIMPMPSTTLGLMPEDFETGVAPIRGIDGGESTFVGGDSVGIAANSEVPDQAWNFIAWTLSDEAQIEVVAANDDVVARTDLATNKYSEQDERLVTINEVAAQGRTPYTLKFWEAFNDPQGPWLPLVRGYVFGDGSTIEADNEAITAVLQSG
ncbi:ABC transporter substrate-binding protein [Phytoactinopolyspora halotolerans]|uniref:Sugar ABC transporter substrate-binding protein n=1 Tax=Phytoactinopolyspora halotolerans TaxID=1981512 RepID=A0A6L9S9C0_9ACTN|nr:sugar ABC transporter substrate-binding protein [Phytoactinopolyspora halotolerans]NEE01816.1 sugar ABC transporter substrate-binding protein [Phytoactinopolyspora halotolerans]